jgi:hypothetical protein
VLSSFSVVWDSLSVPHWRIASFRIFVVPIDFVDGILEQQVVLFCSGFGGVLELAEVDVLHVVLEELTVLRQLVPEWNQSVFDLQQHDIVDSELLQLVVDWLLILCLLRLKTLCLSHFALGLQQRFHLFLTLSDVAFDF